MVHTKLVVITGGPGTGKTSVLKALKKKHVVAQESARLVLTRNKLFRGKNALQVKGRKFQEAIWKLEVRHYTNALLAREGAYIFLTAAFSTDLPMQNSLILKVFKMK